MADRHVSARDSFTPSSLNRLVRDLLSDTLPPLSVEGEIGNLARPASGHVYFALKDDKARIDCALFRRHGQRLDFRPENGMQVLVKGRVSLYEARGSYQLIVANMVEAGEGALQREFERLKKRLDAEGLFASERKQTLPRWPRRIGILSSPSGAAVRDVISVVRRRMPLAQVELLPIPVQGKNAPAAIRAMLQRAMHAARHDVLVVTRGGGSLEDLWAFNDEQLARMIAASPVPVLSAVGHEVDFTLADFAADLRAATPSVAGELLVPDQLAVRHSLQQQLGRLDSFMRASLQARAQSLDHAQVRLQGQRPAMRLSQGRQRLESLHKRLQRSLPMASMRARLAAVSQRMGTAPLERRLQRAGERNRQLSARLYQGERRALRQARERATALRRALHGVSPLATLERGFAIVFDGHGDIVRSAHGVAPGARMQIRFADGSMKVTKTD